MIEKLRLRSQQGDTIIEVLIAIAIVSLILTAAYATSNRNTRTTQDTNERSQAQQLVVQQVEILRTTSASSFDDNNGGCILVDASGVVIAKRGATNAECKFSTDGSPSCTEEPCYTVNILPVAGLGAGRSVYEVSVSWDSLNNNTSRVSLNYEPK